MVGHQMQGRGHLDGARHGARWSGRCAPWSRRHEAAPWSRRHEAPPWAGVLPASLARGVEEARHAGCPLAIVEVADLQLGLPARRSVAVLGHGHRGALPDDVPPETDPAGPPEFETQAGRFGEGAVERGRQGGRLQYEQLHADAPGMGGEAAQQRFMGRGQARRQVQDQQVHRPARDERAGEAQSLLRVGRAEHHEPAQVHAARRRLQRIEGAAEIQPGDDAAGRLGRGHAAQRERRLARRGVATERGRGSSRQAADAEDGIERREAGGHHLGVRDRAKGRVDLRRREEGQGTGGRGSDVGGGGTPDAGGRGDGIDPSSAPEPDGRTPPARFEAGEGGAEGLVGPDRDHRHGPVHDRTNVLSVKPLTGTSLRPTLPTLLASESAQHVAGTGTEAEMVVDERPAEDLVYEIEPDVQEQLPEAPREMGCDHALQGHRGP